MHRRELVKPIIAFALACLLVGSAAVPQDDFTTIFDGKSLAGWHVVPPERAGDWFVRDGLLIGKSNGKGSDIIWKADDLADFELTLSYRFRTPGNSGIHIRGETGTSSSHRVKGYHADLGHVGIGPDVLGGWDFHGIPRGDNLVNRGQRVTIDERGRKHFTKIEDTVTLKDIRKRDWNNVKVVVRGHHMYFSINGKVASEVIDNELAKRMDRGTIGLQLHSGRPMTIEFRDIRLKRLEPQDSKTEKGFDEVVGDQGISDVIEVFQVDRRKHHDIDGTQRKVGAGFQPSVLLDHEGTIHVFFQARLDGSHDRAEKMIGHVVSRDYGRTFSDMRFINRVPMQTYAMSSFLRELPSGKKRISVLTSLSIDETVKRLKDPGLIKERLGIDVTTFSRRGATLILELFSDDAGHTWRRKDHPGIADRVYQRNGREYYLAFINLIGQARRIEAGPYSGRLLIGGPLRGDYLPCPDHPHFRDYRASSSLIYSDDDGESWHFGGLISDETAFEHNEASAVAVNGGRQILLARRSIARSAPGKTMHYSDDGGATWNDGFLTDVAATRCLQVLETHDDLVLCSAPGKSNRTHGQMYFSRDGGKHWSHRLIEEGPFSYSTVNRLAGEYLICCYSRGHHGEHGLAARIFSTGWLDAE